MRTLDLSRGLVAIVDDEDYETLAQHKWSATSLKSSGPYGVRRSAGRMVYLHREILGTDLQVDHISGDTLDNRRSNLREATASQNRHNAGLSKANTSGTKGVHFDARRGKWLAYVGVNGKRVFQKRFDTEQEASEAVKTVRTQLHGAFRRDK